MRVFVILLTSLVAFGQDLLIRNVTVVDANGSRPHTNVLIRAGKVTSVGPQAASAARTVEGKGKFLIPGLWDMHVHLWESDPMLNVYVATGVLGVRDMGSDLKRTRQLRADITAGRIPGPVIFTPGPLVDGPASETTKAPVITVAGPEEGRRAVDTVDESLADFVEVMSRLSLDAYQSIAQRARVRRIPFAGPLPEDVPATVAVDARQKSVEHLFGIALACSTEETELRKRRAEAIARKDYAELHLVRDRTYATFSPSIARTLFGRMARYGVWQTPTLTLRRRLALMDLESLASAPELRYVPAGIRAAWTDPREDLKKATEDQRAAFREDYQFHSSLIPRIRDAGAGLLAGTDTGEAYVVPGFALHDELALLAEAGLTPAEALATATINPARYFGIEDRYGTVAKGKVADLVLLDANPLTDIRNTRKIAAVIRQGRLLDRAYLDRLLAGKGGLLNEPHGSERSKPSPAKARHRAR